jgi:two-component system chemotaxis response regulator CheY
MFNVLIVDDTRSVHAFLKELLSKSEGIKVESAFNGLEAIRVLQNHEKKNEKFDLILLDWEMPEMNGPDTVLEIKRLGIQIPVMMMTTKNGADDITKMLKIGVSEYLMKPFTIDILFEKMAFVTGRTLNYAN